MISCSHFAILIWTVTCRRFALRFIASEHAYFCANPVIVFSSFWWHWTFVFDSWFSGCFVQNCFFLVYHMEILVGPNTRHSLHSLRNWSYSVATTLSSVLTAIQGFACSGSFWLNLLPRCDGQVFDKLHCFLVSLSLLHSKSSISSACSRSSLYAFTFTVPALILFCSHVDSCC